MDEKDMLQMELELGQEDAVSDGQDGARRKHREVSEERSLTNRLNRVEGQIRGIKKMVEDERYCIDIITQVAAVQAALNSFNKVLLERHIKTCVVNDILTGDSDATVEELCKTIQKMMK